MIVEQDQVGLKLEAKSPRRFRVVGRQNVVVLVFEERFPIFSFRRWRVHKQDRRVHVPVPLLLLSALPEVRFAGNPRAFDRRASNLRIIGTWRFDVLGFVWVVLLRGQKERACKCPKTRALRTKAQKCVRRKDGVNCAEPVKFTWTEEGFRAFSTGIRRCCGNRQPNRYLLLECCAFIDRSPSLRAYQRT